MKRILSTLSIDVNIYDLIICEGWELTHALLKYVKNNTIITRIYGTGSLTEKIENNKFWKFNPFFRKLYAVINSNKVNLIIFNSTGSRSYDLFEKVSEKANDAPRSLYLEMPGNSYVCQ